MCLQGRDFCFVFFLSGVFVELIQMQSLDSETRFGQERIWYLKWISQNKACVHVRELLQLQRRLLCFLQGNAASCGCTLTADGGSLTPYGKQAWGWAHGCDFIPDTLTALSSACSHRRPVNSLCLTVSVLLLEPPRHICPRLSNWAARQRLTPSYPLAPCLTQITLISGT